MPNKKDEKKYKIKKEDAVRFVNEINNIFVERGLYSLSKNELYEYIFYLLQKYDENNEYKNGSNYYLARKLKTTESRIKNCKVNIAQKYYSNDEYTQIFDDFLKDITNGNLVIMESSEKENYQIIIENVVTRNTIANLLKSITKDTLDYSFNSEKVKISKESFLLLLQNYSCEEEIEKEKDRIRDKLKQDKNIDFVKDLVSAVLSKDKSFFVDFVFNKGKKIYEK